MTRRLCVAGLIILPLFWDAPAFAGDRKLNKESLCHLRRASYH